jgi:hypothetical protein
MNNYTTPELVIAELRGEEDFTEYTIPKLSTVNTWISQYSDHINNLTSNYYSSGTTVDYYDADKNLNLYLKKTPVLSVEGVYYNDKYDGDTDNWVEKINGIDYTVYPEEGYIKINTRYWTDLKRASRNLRVEYTYGYDNVPPAVEMLATKLVAQRLLDTLMSQSLEERNAGGSISVGDIRIVEPANYGVGTYRELKNSIKELQEEVVKGFRVYRYG